MNQLIEKMIDTMHAFSSNHIMKAIRQGLVNMMPILIIGSFCILINNLPIPLFQDFMVKVFGTGWKSFASNINTGTTQIMSLGILLSISYSIAKAHEPTKQRLINPLTVSLVSLGCLISISDTRDGGLRFTQMGATGLFVAVLVAVLSSQLFFFFCKHRKIKIRVYADEADSLFVQAVNALEPAVLTFLIFCVARLILSAFGIEDIHLFIYDVLKAIFAPLQHGLLAAFVFTFFSQFFWVLGLHGSNIMENVAQMLWVPMLDVNVAAVEAGQVPVEIFTKQFFDVYTKMGGSGSTLCLIIALLIFARNTSSSRLGKLSLPLALFNINETIIYGLPIVLNPFYIIPFLFLPVIQVLIAYAATSLNLVPVVTESVSWTTPILIGGYVATGSIAGAILQLVNLAVGVMVYMPFIKLNEMAKEKSNQQVMKKLNEQIDYVDNQRPQVMLNRQDEVGALARAIAGDLEYVLSKNGNGELFLVYQPQINREGKIFGCETLLRWRHSKLGMIPPPTIITLAEEAKLDTRLNEWIFTEALKAQGRFIKLGMVQVLSINLSPLQLMNESIIEVLKTGIQQNDLDPKMLEIELTENIALDDSNLSKQAMERLKEIGVRLAIDDFGMGHTSLQYIKSYVFDTVKLDGSLVEDILTDKSSADIVKAIIQLADSVHMEVIAEVVETQEQRDILYDFGCHVFQGYLFSKPLEEEAYITFYKGK